MILQFIDLAAPFASPGDPPPASALSPTGQAPSIIQAPIWVKRPTGADLAKLYPLRALQEDQGGEVKMRCRANAKGRLTKCEILSETPADYRFGEAALRAAPLFQMAPMGADGKSVDGALVTISVTWKTR